jgi:hypothetical protein
VCCWIDRFVPTELAKESSSRDDLPMTRERGAFCHLPSFASTDSAAESFRSRCGSVRGAPVCSSQASPIAAPQVVQRTDIICFGVSSLDFTLI